MFYTEHQPPDQETKLLGLHLWVAVTILEVGHQAESFSSHPVTSSPQTWDVVTAERAVFRNGVVLHFFWGLERFHAAGPLAEERLRCVNLDGRLARRRRW